MQAVAGKQTPKTDFYSPFKRHDNTSIKMLINLSLWCARHWAGHLGIAMKCKWRAEVEKY